jgi:hypothetical protein
MKARLAAVAVTLIWAGGCALDSPQDRAAAIEKQLLASCTCHPRKISGLPLETQIREAIGAGIAAGLDDDAILWRVLQTHGNAILRAGIDDLETRALAFVIESGGILVMGLGVLLLQLRRRSRSP